VSKRWRSLEAILLRAVSSSTQVANGRHRPSSFGMVNPEAQASPTLLVAPIRDRAIRLRSSDVPEKGIPDAKNRDVVAIQLWLF